MTPVRIGTRGSPLALWQANHIADRLRPIVAPRIVETTIIQTAGDKVQDVPLTQIGGDGVFTKEIQKALLAETVDIAVHSLKDLPTFPVDGLVLAAVPERGPTGDVLISHRYRSFALLPSGARIATSSMRRRAQILHHRPDLQLTFVRGNVETRLRKLREEDLDGLILAQAGLERLGLAEVMTEILDPQWMLPAVGQGALGLECRSTDDAVRSALEQLDDGPTHAAVLAERTFLRTLGGGCQVPLGALAEVTGPQLVLRAAVLRTDGTGRIAEEIRGMSGEPETLGRRLAETFLARGARALLDEATESVVP